MSLKSAYTLLSNASATGSAVTVTPSGKYVFMAEATFGGGTVKLQFMSPNGTWIDYSGASFTASGATAGLDLPAGQYRANVVTSTAVFAYLIPA